MPFFLETCAKAGFQPEVLGRGKRWAGFGMRLGLIRRALRSLPSPRRIVLFTDAYDSFIVDSADVILERFRKLGQPLLFSAEKNCWPDAWKSFMYPPADTPWRFLNAGGFIGECGAILRHLDRLPHRVPGAIDDQRWWTNQFLCEPDRIQLDTRCELFQTLWDSGSDLELGKWLRNRTTGTCPSVIHGNGWTDLSPYISWYRKLNRLAVRSRSLTARRLTLTPPRGNTGKDPSRRRPR